MSTNDFLDIPVSFYSNMKSPIAQERTVGQVLNEISSDLYKKRIEYLRLQKQCGNVAAANDIKTSLPAVTFCATFNERRRTDCCKHYNSILVIDIDKLSGKEFERVGNCLANEPCVFAYWVSPSGTGWKGLVLLEFLNDSSLYASEDKHRSAFLELEKYLKNTYGIELDASGKDITRLCFVSWDSNLCMKDIAVEFSVDLRTATPVKAIKTPIVYLKGTTDANASSSMSISWNKIDGECKRHNAEYDRMLLEKIYRYLKKRNKSITTTYENWVKVAFSIANTFHSVYGRRKFIQLCELDGDDFDRRKSERLIYDAYCTNDEQCDMATIVYLAKQEGYIG